MRDACSLINKKSNVFEKPLLTLIIFPDADTIAPNAVDACIGRPFKVGKGVDTEADKHAILVSHQNLLGCIGPNGGCQHHHFPILGLCIDE